MFQDMICLLYKGVCPSIYDITCYDFMMLCDKIVKMPSGTVGWKTGTPHLDYIILYYVIL